MSDHRAVIVPVVTEKHPDADTLSIVQPFGPGGYNVVVKTADWHSRRHPQHVTGVPLGVYIPVDCIVPENDPQFAFLGTTARERRIKARKFRGVFSEGLLADVPPAGVAAAAALLRRGLFAAAWCALRGWRAGDDVTDVMGITRYQADADAVPAPKPLLRRLTRGLRQFAVSRGWVKESTRERRRPEETWAPPGSPIPRFTDIENVKKYGFLLQPGEEVVATEKIHGANMRAVVRDGQLYVGSHNLWRNPPEQEPGEPGKPAWYGSSWWWTAAVNAGLAAKLAQVGGDFVFYGEAFGKGVQRLEYGAKDPGDIWFRCFAIYDTKLGHYLSFDDLIEMCATLGVPVVPVVYRGPYDLQHLKQLAEKPSLIGGGIREGLVITPVVERCDRRHGRAIVKLISEKYRLKADV